MAQWLDAHVVKRVNWNDHLFSLQFHCEGPTDFVAGQFTKLGIEQADGKVLSRPYSLVNAPHDQYLEVLAVPVEEGKLSPKLHLLDEGDPLKIMMPATGFLTLQEVPEASVLWMFATGTGVGPFLSMLATDEPWQRFEHVVLVYAARQIADLAYMEMIQKWLNQYPNQFSFVPIISRESFPQGLRGRIPQLLEQKRIQKYCQKPLSHENSHVMMCGNPDMIKETTDILADMGLRKHMRRDPGHITMERYW